MSCVLKVSSLQSLGAVDGPGLRYCIFLQGCNLRCVYCHNPETWNINNGKDYTGHELIKKISRYKTYFGKDGGVTISGGEPLLQANQLNVFAQMLKDNNINLAIDTSGSIINNDVKALLAYKPTILLDFKMMSQDKYNKYIGCDLSKVIDFLSLCQQNNCDVWLRYVAVPTINDSVEEIKLLAQTANKYNCVKRVQILPYHVLGIDKYKNLNIEYPIENLPPLENEKLEVLNNCLRKHLNTNIEI